MYVQAIYFIQYSRYTPTAKHYMSNSETRGGGSLFLLVSSWLQNMEHMDLTVFLFGTSSAE